MRAAGKSLSLFSTPLSLLRPSAAVLRLSSSSPLSAHLRRSRRFIAPLRHLSTVRTSNQASSTSSEASLHAQSLSVCAEWVQLVEFLTHKGYFDRAASYVNELRENGDLSEEFVRVSEALISFADENPNLIRSLPRKDIALVVENISPHLFKNGENSAFRLKSFLNSNVNNGSQAEVAETMDLIPYILSYVCRNNNTNINNIANLVIDESIKSLLVHLVNSSKTNQRQSPVRNIINDLRPKIILTGQEWDCPKCNFFNHGTNISCLRCDLKRPGKITKTPSKLEDILNKSNISDNGSNPNKDFEINQTLDKIFNPSNNSKLNNESNRESLANVNDPNPNPRQNNGPKPSKDLNQQETNNNNNNNSNNNYNNNSNNNINNWESLANQMGETGHVPFNPLPINIFGKKIKPNSTDLDATKGEKRFITRKKKDGYNRRIDFEQANNDNNNGNNNSGFVPFVPLPSDYFAKKRENKTSHSENSYSNKRDEGSYSKDSYSDKSDEGSYSENSYSSKSDADTCIENSYSDKKQEVSYSENIYSKTKKEQSYSENNHSNNKPGGSYSENSYSNNNEIGSYSKNNYSNNNKNSYPENSNSKLDMSEEAKTERWFKRAAQINDISELANIPDEDFPEIMPMRKGVNRFVVSKRKTPLERRLSETKYRRHGREGEYLSDS